MAFVAFRLRSNFNNGMLPLFRSCTTAFHSRHVMHSACQWHRGSSSSLLQIGHRNAMIFPRSFPCQVSRSAFTPSQGGAARAFPSTIHGAVRCLLSRLSPQARRTFSSHFGKKLPFEPDVVTKDTLIYSFPNDSFYKLLTYFGIGQFAFWMYLSVFAFTTLRDAPVKEQEEMMAGSMSSENASWWRRINLGESKFKNGISLLCFSVGYIVLFISLMYPLRAVRDLTILRGGQAVNITTYGWLGKKRAFTVPVNHINAMRTRTDESSQIPVKVKGRWFFFLLDKRGIFHNPGLFDFNVGLKRKF